MRISFWLWLRTVATWVDLYKLTCGLDGHTKRGLKPNARSHRVRRAPEVRRQADSLAGTAEPSPAGEDHVIASGRVQADSIRRESCKRERPELLIDSAAIGEDVMRGLIEDWIVPAVVDRLIRHLLQEPPEETKG